jgi:hypothetical protein
MAAKNDGAWVLIARWIEGGGWLPAIASCTIRSTFPSRQAALDAANANGGRELADASEWCTVPATVWTAASR